MPATVNNIFYAIVGIIFKKYADAPLAADYSRIWTQETKDLGMPYSYGSLRVLMCKLVKAGLVKKENGHFFLTESGLAGRDRAIAKYEKKISIYYTTYYIKHHINIKDSDAVTDRDTDTVVRYGTQFRHWSSRTSIRRRAKKPP